MSLSSLQPTEDITDSLFQSTRHLLAIDDVMPAKGKSPNSVKARDQLKQKIHLHRPASHSGSHAKPINSSRTIIVLSSPEKILVNDISECNDG